MKFATDQGEWCVRGGQRVGGIQAGEDRVDASRWDQVRELQDARARVERNRFAIADQIE